MGLIGKQVELRYHPEHPESVEIFDNQQSRGFVLRWMSMSTAGSNAIKTTTQSLQQRR
ncbi:MAG: Mu transposase C-terminal domain-containing protein [Halobacteriales archaeon]|nr:Mu transposase C-terminal domain-containing protein [Halobacteriales archaeon]